MKRPKTEEDSVKLACRDCKMPFESKGQYKRAADGVICRDQPSCRQRSLSVELGIDLFTRYPRERTFYEMDARPANAKKGWKSIFTEDERVMAGWIYYSWCYPVGFSYAVQIDADDEVMFDRYGAPRLMTQERLGKIIGIPQPNISRASNRLEARNMLRMDDGRVYPVAKPKISENARDHISTDILPYIGERPGAIPQKYRQVLNSLLADAPEDIRTDMQARSLALCTAYNEAHKDIRTTRDQGLEHVCTELATLLSRQVDFEKRAGGVSTTKPAQTRPPAQKPPHDGLRDPAAKELYEAIPALQAQYPNSQFGRSRFSMGKADLELVSKILDRLEPTGYDAEGFLQFVLARFKNRRSPNDENGPRSLGLLIDWAKDYAWPFASIPRPVSAEEKQLQAAQTVLADPSSFDAESIEWAKGVIEAKTKGAGS